MKEMENRRSIRKYKPLPVEQEKLQAILEAARIAPSGSNTQPTRLLVVTDAAMKEKIAAADHNQKWMLDAPVFIIVLADLSVRTDVSDPALVLEHSPLPELKLVIRDSSIAVTQMLLEVEAQGLGACWTGWYNQAEMHAVLSEIGVPDNFYITAVIPIGYADEAPAMRPRKSLEEIVHYDKWN